MVKIDRLTGEVIQTVSFEPLYDAQMKRLKENGEYESFDHANNLCHGIAFDHLRREFYVTGKRWDMLFKIRLL